MMNTMIKKSPNLVIPIPRRNNEARDEEIDNDDGIIYPPEYSVTSPIPIDDSNSLPLAPAVLVEEHNTHSAEERRSRFDPFRPIHPQCNHISYGCLTMLFLVFVGMAVLLKTYLPVAFPGVIPYTENKDLKSYNSYQPSPHLAAEPLSKVSSNPSPRPTVTRSNPPSISIEPSPSPSFLPTLTRSNLPSISTEPSSSPSFLPTVTRSNSPSMYLSHPPSITRNKEKKLVASDRSGNDMFGVSCSMSDELVLIGAREVDNEGAAYLFHLDGTEVKKLTPGNDGKEGDRFGTSVSMDEKVVVGTGIVSGSFSGGYVRVFSRNGIYERTIRCIDCEYFGWAVATLGNKIVTNGRQNSTNKLFIYSTEESEMLKSFEQEDVISDVAISEQFIVSTSSSDKTIIYSNTSPDFHKITEIYEEGTKVAVSSERILVGDFRVNDYDGAAYLYKTDGTLVKTLDRQDASSESYFGGSVAIKDNKLFVGALGYNNQGYRSGSVFIYSAVTGEFIEKVVAPDGKAWNWFGSSVCTSDSYYVVGATGVDNFTGAAYLFQSSED